MAEEPSKDSLYQKLQRIHSQVKYIQKSQKAKQYNYAGSSDVLGQIHGLMDDEGLLLVPSIVDHNVSSVKHTRNGRPTTIYFTEIDMKMTWINSDNPMQALECPWYAQGVDIAGEKRVGKALTYGEKYFLLKFFNIATDDVDPDSFQQTVESKKQPEPIASEQRKQLNDLFSSMAGVTGASEDKVRIGYLHKASVNNISELNHDSAHQLIELVTNQLNKQTGGDTSND